MLLTMRWQHQAAVPRPRLNWPPYSCQTPPAYVPQPALQAGVFFPNSRTTLNQIIDGTSHTS